MSVTEYTGTKERPFNPDKCKAVVYSRSLWASRGRQCRNKVANHGWCMVHHPDKEKERERASQARFEAYQRERRYGYHGLSLKRKLEEVADFLDGRFSHDSEARTMADSIRKAIANG